MMHAEKKEKNEMREKDYHYLLPALSGTKTNINK